MVAPITASMVGGNELLHVVVGQAGHQQTANLPPPHGSRVLPYHLGATQTAVNGIDGQMARPAPQAGAASAAAGTGDAPYTAEQVTAGAAVFGKQCASCHGAQLQGLAAPALTGAPFIERALRSRVEAQRTGDYVYEEVVRCNCNASSTMHAHA